MQKIVVMFCLLLVGLAACEKPTHKVIASKGDGTTWTIDQMIYSQSDASGIVHDTIIYEAGRFVFKQDKRRFEHGQGTLYRREYVSDEWSVETQQEFQWFISDENIEVTYESGEVETFSIEENKRNAQHWQSLVTSGFESRTRTYFLNRSFDD